MRFYKIILFFFFPTLIFSQLNTGTITDSVKIKNHAYETYSLYLPSHYKADQLNAIVFIFDPSGSGKNGIKPFVKAAEEYNYILICSNFAKNGPMNKNFDIANRLFSDVLERFNIDPNQIYAAGFSGGSRFATAIAVMTNRIQAVVACGSGFPDNIIYAPTEPKFTYAGIVGNKDMNYSEMANNHIYLNKLNFTNDLFVFDGIHRWPSPDEITHVFDWLELIAYKKRIRPVNNELIKKSYQKMLERSELTASLVRKEAILTRISNAFGPYIETDSIKTELLSLRNSKAYKDEKNALSSIFELEEALIKKLTGRFHSEYSKPEKANYKWWTKEIEKLDKLALKNTRNKNMIERLKYKLFELAYTRSRPEYFNLKENQKNYCFELIKILYPNKFE